MGCLGLTKMKMKKGGKDNQYRRIRVESQYQGFDFFLLKKPMQCTVKIPETVLLDKNGAVKQWIFNSHKLPQHPILKKRRENLLPFTIVRNFCSKQISFNQLSSLKTIHDLKETLRTALLGKKDAQFASKKKHIQIRTVDNDILQVNILEFLDYVGQNKFAQQNFYDKWRMIQQRVSSSKLDQSYLVQSVRRNHIIESKSSKYIAVNTGQKVSVDTDSNDPFKQAMPSKQLQVVQTKIVQGYKFFDTYLNKKFFAAVQQIIDSIQKNYKCLVQSITTRFVIDQDRQPHLAAIQQVYLKPTAKLFQMREFGQYIVEGTIRLQNYMRCLQQFILQNPSRPQLNLQQPLSQQRKNRCRGDFCDVTIDSLPHFPDQKIKLPSIGRYNAYNARQMSSSFIECVKKRKRRVIQKLKENGLLDSNFELNDQDSSEYEDSDDEGENHVRVCEHCFVFYINVLKYFELDPFNNLVEKKQAATVRTKTVANTERILQNSIIHKEESKQEQAQLVKYKSLKTLHNKMKIIEDKKEAEAILKRSVSQHTKLRPIEEIPNKFDRSVGKQESQQKKISLTKDKPKVIVNSNKLIEAKLKNVASQQTNKKSNSLTSNIAKGSNTKKNAKPNNFYQAAEQLVDKLQLIKASNQQQFIILAIKYYTDNLPQFVDRVSYSNYYMTNLYQFMSISPIGLAAGNRIKKRPEMSLKRLSQLTNYPQIVSRSTFHFDTLICDEKTTIPFCVISTKMIHNNNKAGVPYKNIVLVNDIFDSYIQYISMVKQILQEAQNTRFILFNYHGQSHTIYDKLGTFQGSDFTSILDKLLYRLGTYDNQLNIISPAQTISFVGYGFGGYLVQCYLSMCPHLHHLVPKVMLINSPNYLTKKYKEIFTSLRQLYSVDDKITEENSFLFYNKAINSTQVEKQDLQNKSGLNSIRIDGRAFLLNNAILYWNDTAVDTFIDYNGTVIMIYSKNDILMTKQDLQSLLYKPDADRTVLKNRTLIQIDGGHDIAAENYNQMIKNIYTLVQ